MHARKYEEHDSNIIQGGKDESGGQPLGHFEYGVLCAIQQLEEAAYPAEITRLMTANLKRHVAVAQVYIALSRLNAKGMISRQDAPGQSGRKRVFKIEHSGVRAMQVTATAYGVPPQT